MSVFAYIPLFIGCATEAPDYRSAQPVDLNDVATITLVTWEFTLDGGTSTLGAFTNEGYLCSIRLNQHAIAGEFPLNADISPGRLFFNDSLIEVRSSEEERLIGLLKGASVSLVELEDLRRLARNLPIDSATIEALAVADDDHLLERTRDEIVGFVLSGEYVDIARNGLPASDSG